MILVLLTIIGISASNISVTEVQIATNSLLHERAFYTAESGLQHAKEVLKLEFRDDPENKLKLATGAGSDWDFAIENASASGYDGNLPRVNTTLADVRYTVTVWNNADDVGGATDDTDRRVLIRSVARGPRGAVCQIETLLDASSSAIAITGDYAQEGSEAGKGYTSQDLEKITVFNNQLGSP